MRPITLLVHLYAPHFPFKITFYYSIDLEVREIIPFDECETAIELNLKIKIVK